jgi:hypothetical protein
MSELVPGAIDRPEHGKSNGLRVVVTWCGLSTNSGSGVRKRLLFILPCETLPLHTDSLSRQSNPTDSPQRGIPALPDLERTEAAILQIPKLSIPWDAIGWARVRSSRLFDGSTAYRPLASRRYPPALPNSLSYSQPVPKVL